MSAEGDVLVEGADDEPLDLAMASRVDGVPDLSDAACVDALARWATSGEFDWWFDYYISIGRVFDARFDEDQYPVFMTRLHGLYAIIMERFSWQGTVVDVGGFDIRVRANRWWALTPSSNAGAQRLVLVDFGVKWVAPGVFETIVGASRKQRRVQVPGQTEPGMLWVEPSTLTAAA